MAFPNHLSDEEEIPLQHFSEHHLPLNSSTLLRNTITDNKPSPTPTWLNPARHFSSPPDDSNFLNLHTNTNTHPSSSSTPTDQWLLHPPPTDIDAMASAISHESPDLHNRARNDNSQFSDAVGNASFGDVAVNWQTARYKTQILSHPLYEQLLSAHVACLRIATPVDQLSRIDGQLAHSQQVVAKYSALGHGNLGDDKELDQFMTHYVLLLCSFKEQLQQHVRVHAMEAVMACWEIEQSLQSLTGVSPGEGTGATMSDEEDDDEQVDSDGHLFDMAGGGGHDSMGFGPLILTDSEKSLMERVRQELKHELKNGYKEKLVDIREEILRKRRAGKLPGDTTSVLKAWWQSHSKWPYPTEEDKARLVEETGLQLKQINNWFINQRKRKWHSNSSSSTASKSKRKSNNAGENSNNCDV